MASCESRCDLGRIPLGQFLLPGCERQRAAPLPVERRRRLGFARGREPFQGAAPLPPQGVALGPQ
eukprot:3154888-Pyramimonas_sp.AAC.3